MAVLSNPERAVVCGDYQRDKSDVRQGIPVTEPELRAAVNAIDDWLDANAASLNTAIPQPARAALTTQQKLDMILRILQRRVKGN